MEGSSHAVSGLLVGALTAPVAPVSTLTERVAWTAAWGGFALLPDLDSHGSRAARMWGVPTRLLGQAIGRLAKGHRMGTHDALLAPPAFAAVAALGMVHRWAAVVVLAFAVGLALLALDPILPGKQDRPLVNLVLSGGAGWALAGAGISLWWLPIAAAGGVLVHLAGDLPTTGGLPVPLLWRTTRPCPTYGPRLFHVGSRVEDVIRGLLWIALLALTAYYLRRA